MTEQTVLSAINMLAEKLGVAASQIYPVLRAQAKLSVITSGIKIVICVLFITFAVWFTRELFLSKKYDSYGEKVTFFKRLIDDDKEGTFILFCVTDIVLVVSSIIFAFCLFSIIQNAITATFNPDFWILKYILSVLSSANS